MHSLVQQKLWIFSIIAAIFIPSSPQTFAQTLEISGVISTATVPVQNASITFVNVDDPLEKYIAYTNTSGQYRIDADTGIVHHPILPVDFKLDQNYPNPFIFSTSIPYQLNRQSDVLISIYDILGREVKRFAVSGQTAGPHGIIWDGKNSEGQRTATGIYFCRLEVEGKIQAKKMIHGLYDINPHQSLPKFSSAKLEAKEIQDCLLFQAKTFSVIIENTISTYPNIVPQNFKDLIVQNDTTLDFNVITNVPNSAIVYTDTLHQIIRGFGAANIIGWRPDMTDDQIDRAFGTGEGQIGFTIMRLRVSPDSSEFSANISTAQKAHGMGVTIIASPWTPPAWMKTNGDIVGGSLRTDAYTYYASHLKSFADTLSNNGVPLYAVSLQNEPDVTVTYESCYWDAAQFLNFTKNNASAAGIKIFMPESADFNHTLSDATLNDPAAAANVLFIGGHLYGGGLTSYPLALSKSKELWMTEHLVLDTSWTSVFGTAREINDCMNADMSAYIWWYIVRYYGPIHEDGHVTKRGFVMSQYSRFIRPGFFRIAVTKNPRPSIYVTAYKNGSNIVIVALNNGSSVTQTFICPDGTMSAFTPYVTSSTKSCFQESDIPLVNGAFTTTLNSSSITTFVSK